MAKRKKSKGILSQLRDRVSGGAEKPKSSAKARSGGAARSAVIEDIGRPNFASADHPLKDGIPPDWASGWGEDRYGVWIEFTLGEVVQRMRWIGPGWFRMGSPEDEPGRWGESEAGGIFNEGPQHDVRLNEGIWLFDTPVTQALWGAAMGENPSRFVDPKRPVEQVSWNDAEGFLERINSLVTGLNLILPTEAQWEYACRSGTDAPNYVGGEAELPDIAWFEQNSDGQTQPVAMKRCNAWGLHDMLGNVWEWCADNKRKYDAAPATDPVGPLDGAQRALRGGAWYDDARFVRAASRFAGVRGSRNVSVGFRCARVRS